MRKMRDMSPAEPPPAEPPHAEPTRLAPGTRLNGIFEVDSYIASGRLGEIYRAHAVETGDPVAIKMMHAGLAGSALALALFRREAAMLHDVHHDAIVRDYLFSHDSGTGRHYLAMEFVDGEPLSALMERGPLGFGAVHGLQQRLAAGLDVAHQCRIVHGDLSPARVLIPGVDFSGDNLARAKIIGFGASQLGSDGVLNGGGGIDKDYAAPEQFGLFGGNVTAQSDIYSLGLVLAACLRGRPLDMGRAPVEILQKRRAAPDLSGLDRRLRPLIERMLQPDPADRLDSMAAVAAWRPETVSAPGGVPRGRSVSRTARPSAAVATTARWQRRLAFVAAEAAGILALAGAVGLYVAQDRSDPGTLAPTHGDARPEIAQPDRPIAGSRQRIVDFVTAYDGGDCFFVAPEEVDDGKATLDGLGSAVAPFEVFDYEFKRRNGFEPTIGLHQVMAEQCPAVSFLFHTRHHRNTAPRLAAGAVGLKDGAPLTGSVSDTGTGIVELLLVADDGYVRNLTALLKPGAGGRTFAAGIRKTSPGPPRPMILMAVASAKPLEALKLPPDGTLAAEVFPKVLAEALHGGMTLGVSAKYFMLEK
jgi:serine/threonine-protein kinase